LAPLIPQLFGKKAYLGRKSRLALVVIMCFREQPPVAHRAERTRLDLMAALQAHGVHGKVALVALLGMLVMVALEATVALLLVLLVAVEVVAAVVVVVELPT
jgi:hypothetical protein